MAKHYPFEGWDISNAGNLDRYRLIERQARDRDEPPTEVTREEYEVKLNIMPPIYCEKGGFLVCEALTDDIYAMYRRIGDRYYGKYVVKGDPRTYITAENASRAYPVNPAMAEIARDEYVAAYS